MTTHKICTICYDTHSKSFMYKASTKTLPPLHVLIRTTHSGLCTTDVHAKHKGCGLGHEGVGLIERLGKGVNNVSLGQRVGWGWLHSVRCPDTPERITSTILTRG
jgi:alcohol dehydrogenase (NADP+)